MEWLLADEDVGSVELQYRLKMTITFDPNVGSLSNIYRDFQRLFSLGVPMEWLLGDRCVLSASIEYRLTRAITFDPTIGSRSNFYKGFQRLFSGGIYRMPTR
jgi:hypothetical protein